MKRGIVMDVRSRKAVVLTKDGGFTKVPLKKYPYVEIGEEVVVPASSTVPLHSKGIPLLSAVAAAAIFLVIVLSSFPLSPNNGVAAFISLDINPSVEAGVNHQLEVIELKALNKDGESIISQIGSFEDMTLQQLLTAFLSASESSGYLENSKNMLVSTTIMDDASIQKSVSSEVDKWQQQHTSGAGLVLTTVEGESDQRQQAQENGVSTGKYLMYLRAKEKMSIDEVKTLSVEQLNNRLQNNQTDDSSNHKSPEKPIELPASVESVDQADTSGQTSSTSGNKPDIPVNQQNKVVEMEEGLKSSQYQAPNSVQKQYKNPVIKKPAELEKVNQQRKPQIEHKKKLDKNKHKPNKNNYNKHKPNKDKNNKHQEKFQNKNKGPHHPHNKPDFKGNNKGDRGHKPFKHAS